MLEGLIRSAVRGWRRLSADDLLDAIGLERTRPGYPKYVLLGVGLLVGAGVGMLLAPRSGRELRGEIGGRLDELGGRLEELRKGANGGEPDAVRPRARA
jgi:hypothetical protein